jgi:hypothetical protein
MSRLKPGKTLEEFEAYLADFERRHRNAEHVTAASADDKFVAHMEHEDLGDTDAAFLKNFVEYDWASNASRDHVATRATHDEQGVDDELNASLQAVLPEEADSDALERLQHTLEERLHAAPGSTVAGRFSDAEVQTLLRAREEYLAMNSLVLTDLHRDVGGHHAPHLTRIAGMAALPGRDLESVQRKIRELSAPCSGARQVRQVTPR